MSERVQFVQKTTNVIDGRPVKNTQPFYKCWCDVKSLGSTETYKALEIGVENAIVFECRACKKVEEMRLNLKEFYAIYRGVEFKVYDASPMFTNSRMYRIKCKKEN